MKASGPRNLLIVLVVVLVLGVCASAQLQPVPEMPITGNATVATTYFHSTQTGGLDNFNLGLSGDFNGYYHNPSFLQFQVTPFYDLGREYTETQFSTGGKGVGASLNLFGGGSFPLMINYRRATTSEATYNIIGAPAGIGGNGTTQDLSINWTMRLRRLPTVQVSYLKNDGEFTVLGTDARGDSHGDGYAISMQYAVLGFNLMGLYDSHNLSQDLPNIFTSVGNSVDSRQRNLRFGISRTLPHSTYFDSSAERSHWKSDATGRLEDRTFDTVTAGLTSRLTNKLSTNFRVNYVSDLTGLWLSSIISGGSPGGPTFPVLSSDTRFRTMIYTEGVNYDVGRGFRLQGTAQQGSASDSTGKVADNSTINTQVNYNHDLKGGAFMASYGLGISTIDTRYSVLLPGLTDWSGTTVGHSGSLGYSHQIGRGRYSGTLHYSQSNNEAPLLLKSRSYGGEISGQNMIHGWNIITAVRLDKINVSAFNALSSLQKGFRISAARGRVNVAFSEQFTDGLSITTLDGLHPIPPVPGGGGAEIILGRLFAPTASRSTSVTGNYMATKHLEFDLRWIRSSYETIYLVNNQTGVNDQFDFMVKYHFRLLDCRAGYRRYHQEFSGIAGLYNAQTVYFQVSRRFHLF